nr:disease resistance protein RPP13-like isoform X6 [Ipomoea batatas]GMD68039.1 disease resistance protein RPP13-like isoform X6 [Ipomoea batatas]
MNPNNHIGRLENLKKLVFCDITFRWKAVNSLSKLPKLEVLKLLRCSPMGEAEWKLSKKEKFEQLIYLKIDAIDLKCWEASAYHFSKLECLILSRCSKLEEIPANFAEISNLKSIKLIRCLPFAVASAKQIWEEQHEQGNDDMIVIEEDTKQILELGGLEDEDLGVGDDYYPRSGSGEGQEAVRHSGLGVDGTLMESLAVCESSIWQGRWKKRQERLAIERRETMKRAMESGE